MPEDDKKKAAPKEPPLWPGQENDDYDPRKDPGPVRPEDKK